MIVSFFRWLCVYPWGLQEIPVNKGAFDITVAIECNSNEFTKSRWIVVSNRLCVAKGFQDRIGLENLTFKCLTLCVIMTAGNGSQILNDNLCVLCLSCSWLTTDECLIHMCFQARCLLTWSGSIGFVCHEAYHEMHDRQWHRYEVELLLFSSFGMNESYLLNKSVIDDMDWWRLRTGQNKSVWWLVKIFC